MTNEVFKKQLEERTLIFTVSVMTFFISFPNIRYFPLSLHN